MPPGRKSNRFKSHNGNRRSHKVAQCARRGNKSRRSKSSSKAQQILSLLSDAADQVGDLVQSAATAFQNASITLYFRLERTCSSLLLTWLPRSTRFTLSSAALIAAYLWTQHQLGPQLDFLAIAVSTKICLDLHHYFGLRDEYAAAVVPLLSTLLSKLHA